MPTLFALLLPLVGCATMMFFCGRMMRRSTCAMPSDDGEQVARLRAEIAELRDRIEPAAARTGAS